MLAFLADFIVGLHLAVVLGALRRSPTPAVFAALACIPLVRADAAVVWFGDAILLLLMARDRRRTLGWIVLSGLPNLAHLHSGLVDGVFHRATDIVRI